jgi:hypothetical protein
VKRRTSDGGFQPPARHEEKSRDRQIGRQEKPRFPILETPKKMKHNSNPLKAQIPDPTTPTLFPKQEKVGVNILERRIQIDHAHEAAHHLSLHLHTPSALEYLSPRYMQPIGATLCQASEQRPIIPAPTELFTRMQLSATEIPEDWLPAYAHHSSSVRRTKAFAEACLRLDRGAGKDMTITDPIVAGLLLYLSSATVDAQVRREWMVEARNHPVGGWLAAEGLHTVDERGVILDAVQHDSRLLYWTSQIPGFGRASVKHACSRLDLYGGLIMSLQGDADQFGQWLSTTALAAGERPDAACAALVLQPGASQRDQACWISTLATRQAARYAYEALRWTRHTWPHERWQNLVALLRPYIVSDRSQFFFHFFRDINPELALGALGDGEIDPLWGVQLISEIGPTCDDYPFRFRMDERLSRTGDIASSLVISFLNQRLRGGSCGSPGGRD